MSDKYCLAGKVECEYSCRDGKACCAGLMTGDGISPLLEWKIYSCVYPHLRRPPKTDQFAVGRLAGIEECIKAVNDELSKWNQDKNMPIWEMLKSKLNAVLEKLRGRADGPGENE